MEKRKFSNEVIKSTNRMIVDYISTYKFLHLDQDGTDLLTVIVSAALKPSEVEPIMTSTGLNANTYINSVLKNEAIQTIVKSMIKSGDTKFSINVGSNITSPHQSRQKALGSIVNQILSSPLIINNKISNVLGKGVPKEDRKDIHIVTNGKVGSFLMDFGTPLPITSGSNGTAYHACTLTSMSTEAFENGYSIHVYVDPYQGWTDNRIRIINSLEIIFDDSIVTDMHISIDDNLPPRQIIEMKYRIESDITSFNIIDTNNVLI